MVETTTPAATNDGYAEAAAAATTPAAAAARLPAASTCPAFRAESAAAIAQHGWLPPTAATTARLPGQR